MRRSPTVATTTRVTWTRQLPHFGLRLLPLLGLAALLAIGAGPVRARIEQDLTERATAALVTVGLDDDLINVHLTGRDAELSGTVPRRADRALAVTAVAGTPGVRAVSADDLTVRHP